MIAQDKVIVWYTDLGSAGKALRNLYQSLENSPAPKQKFLAFLHQEFGARPTVEAWEAAIITFPSHEELARFVLTWG